MCVSFSVYIRNICVTFPLHALVFGIFQFAFSLGLLCYATLLLPSVRPSIRPFAAMSLTSLGDFFPTTLNSYQSETSAEQRRRRASLPPSPHTALPTAAVLATERERKKRRRRKKSYFGSTYFRSAPLAYILLT